MRNLFGVVQELLQAQNVNFLRSQGSKKLCNSDKKVCNFCSKETESSFHEKDFWTLHPEKLSLIYVVAVERYQVQYGKYFSSF